MISMTAVDSFFATGIGMVHARQMFHVDSESQAADLEKAGHATRAATSSGEKDKTKPDNKSAPAPRNKAAPGASTKSKG